MEKAVEILWNRIEKGMRNWKDLIENSFLSDDKKETFLEIIDSRVKQLNLNFRK